MGDGAASVDQVPPSDGGELAADGKKPADEAARAKEADRAKRRRMMEKLKGAKSENELRALMAKFAGVVSAEEAEGLELPVDTGPLEPGQQRGWPKPSEVAEVEQLLVEGLEGTGGFVEFVVEKAMQGDTDEKAVALTVAACLKEEPGKQLAKAWAPLATLYMPAVMKTPHAAAVIGSLKFGGMVMASVNATLDARDAARAEAKKKKDEPK